ncbi:hypothetical protein GCM10022200_30650 [Microbacterium awajiense]|uniref:Helicase XPB/Ssl2 N-terminal domain-containing protein n=1 Tax=Microbacterium awajiense TaxID=415214 RepID=A0ABP7B0E5_9MICO
MISDERVLASWLAARDDDALAATLSARSVARTVPWQDFFDAAEGLLDPTSIERALRRRSRTELAALLGGGDARTVDRLRASALVRDDGTPYTAVSAVVDALRGADPQAFERVDTSTAPRTADPKAAAAAAERVFAASGSLTDVLLETLAAPLARTGVGSVSAADRKRLIEGGAVADGDELDDQLAAALAAGLARAGAHEWLVTPAADDWLELSTPDRWAVVVCGIRSVLPAGLRTPDGGYLAIALWRAAYPLDPAWPDTAEALQRLAHRWGLSGDTDDEEPEWATPLRLGSDADTASLSRMLPAEIDRLYLQADLSAIAPGPLAPALDLRLRRIARRESRAQASTYRFTADSLASGVTEGETAESIRAFLGRLSLTGIPQPLDYLIQTTAARHGLVEVTTDAATGRTRVSSSDRDLLRAIEVDQALRALGLLVDGDVLTTRVARDAVYWSLADARYPVVAHNGAGEPEALHRRVADADDPATDSPGAYGALIAAWRAGHGVDGEDAWLERELDQAVRAKAVIIVVVRMPDGTERSFTLEASGLGGGRLRGRDRGADIERTLPVSSIIRVQSA